MLLQFQNSTSQIQKPKSREKQKGFSPSSTAPLLFSLLGPAHHSLLRLLRTSRPAEPAHLWCTTSKRPRHPPHVPAASRRATDGPWIALAPPYWTPLSFSLWDDPSSRAKAPPPNQPYRTPPPPPPLAKRHLHWPIVPLRRRTTQPIKVQATRRPSLPRCEPHHLCLLSRPRTLPAALVLRVAIRICSSAPPIAVIAPLGRTTLPTPPPHLRAPSRPLRSPSRSHTRAIHRASLCPSPPVALLIHTVTCPALAYPLAAACFSQAVATAADEQSDSSLHAGLLQSLLVAVDPPPNLSQPFIW